MSDQPKYNSKVAAAADWCLGCVCLIIVSCPVATMFTFQAYTSKRRARDHEKLLKGKVDRREPTSYRERYELGLELLDPREWQRRRESYRKPRRPWGHEESGFAKLPPELRMKIYEMAYGFCGIHVSKYKSEDRNWGIPCKHDPSDGKWCFHNCVAGTRRDYYRRQGCVGRHVTEWIPPDPGIGLLNLMLVCRFM